MSLKLTIPQNLFNGSSCFFIGGGPSLNNHDLNPLSQRGILTFAVNNIAARNVKPNIWCSCDDPISFHKSIWRDPSILKLINSENYDKEYPGGRVKDCPNVVTFPLNKDFDPKSFFTEDTVNYGNHAGKRDILGQTGHRSVFYCSIRLMHYLGIKRIFLLGCDFCMEEQQPYAFEQGKWRGGVASNNIGYEKMAARFNALKPFMGNFKIYNCGNSSYNPFPRYDYNTALEQCIINPAKDGDLANMYLAKNELITNG